MLYLSFAVRDSKLEDFSIPLHQPTVAAALRSFASMTLNPENGQIHTHPEDFALFRVGTYDSANPSKSEWDLQPTLLALATEFHTSNPSELSGADAPPAIGRHAQDDDPGNPDER